MNRKSGELIKAKKIIEGDKLDAKDEFFSLLSNDVDYLLKEYFDYSGTPNITVQKDGGDFKVAITLLANRIKNFSSIPKI